MGSLNGFIQTHHVASIIAAPALIGVGASATAVAGTQITQRVSQATHRQRQHWTAHHSTGRAIPRPRGAWLFEQGWMLRLVGLPLMAFAMRAIAPPFSGLDTLPAMGAVAVALAIILEDMVVLAIGP